MFLDQLPVPPQQRAQMNELVLRMEDIVYMAGRPRFDRVRLVMDSHELWFIWEEDKLVIIVELDANPEAVAAAFERATAAGGSAVLN